MSANNEHKITAQLDGARTKTIRTFYRKIAKQLDFPDYFDPNLDALADCLSDLSWLEKKNVVLFIKNIDQLLAAEENETREAVMEILKEAVENQIEEDRTFEVVAER